MGLFVLPIMAAIVVDLNNSGLIHLFRRQEEQEDSDDSIIRTEGIDA